MAHPPILTRHAGSGVAAMQALRAITTCVGTWYSRTLELALPHNRQHFVECVVVTKPNDRAVPIARAAGVEVFETTAFVDHGAAFNNRYALEQGFDVLGRHGWIAIIDADIVLPPYMPWMHLDCLAHNEDRNARLGYLIEKPLREEEATA
jgi:hypothetical protein